MSSFGDDDWVISKVSLEPPVVTHAHAVATGKVDLGNKIREYRRHTSSELNRHLGVDRNLCVLKPAGDAI